MNLGSGGVTVVTPDSVAGVGGGSWARVSAQINGVAARLRLDDGPFMQGRGARKSSSGHVTFLTCATCVLCLLLYSGVMCTLAHVSLTGKTHSAANI